MSEQLLSVGIDIGTSTTQLVFSQLTVENESSVFTIPRYAISEKEIIYRSEIYFTPLLSETVIDANAIQKIVDQEYLRSGVMRGQIQTGAVIITGETARKVNAKQVLSVLSGYAGDFVVATAGPDLESVLAGKGAGADEYSRDHQCAVLNFDIGGGTSNLALFDKGTLVDAGCLNVGGRLLKLDQYGTITYLSPVLSGRFPLHIGQRVEPEELAPLIDELVHVLEAAAGLREQDPVYQHYITTSGIQLPSFPVTVSFSGGVAELIFMQDEPHWLKFGDIGILLAKRIRSSELMQISHICGKETIRATVVGAGSHSTEVSGSTIRYEGVRFPIKNIPVISLYEFEEDLNRLKDEITARILLYHDGDHFEPAVLAMHGRPRTSYADVCAYADAILSGCNEYLKRGLPLLLCIEHDMAKALGQRLIAHLPKPPKLVCLDSLSLQTGQYLDIGAPIADGAVLPVVIKTLIFTS